MIWTPLAENGVLKEHKVDIIDNICQFSIVCWISEVGRGRESEGK